MWIFYREGILPSNQSQIIDQGNFRYSPLRKALEKQTEAIEDVAKKQTKEIEDRFEKQILNADEKSISDLFSNDF